MEELTEIAVGARPVGPTGSTVPVNLASTAHDLLPQSLEAELTSRMDELREKSTANLAVIQPRSEFPGKLGESCNGCSPRPLARIDLFSSSLGRRADCAMRLLR